MGIKIVDQTSSAARPPQRRQRYSDEFKHRIVVETFTTGESLARIARQHGINANQLSTWRRLYTKKLLAENTPHEPRLLPVTIHDEMPTGTREAVAPASAENCLTLILPKGQLTIHGRPDLEALRMVLQAMTA